MENTRKNYTIFSTGVHLQAVKCKIMGKEQWRWVAVGFEDDSYLNGKKVDPVDYAADARKMVESFDSE